MMAGLGAAWGHGHWPESPFGQQAGRSSEGQAEVERIILRAEGAAAAGTELELTNGSRFVTGIDSGRESGLKPRLELEQGTGAEHDLCWAVQGVTVHQQCLQLGWGGVEGSSGGMAACRWQAGSLLLLRHLLG